jgi:predicted amidophosphoribosyltransferase
MIPGLESIIGMAMLLGGASIAAGVGGSLMNAFVHYMMVNKLSNTALNVTDRVVAGFGRNAPLPPTGGCGGGGNDNDEGTEKKAQLRDILVKEYGLYPVNISVIPGTGMIAQISADQSKRLDANSLRYLASRMGMPVAITYVRVCGNCRATAQPEVERCPSCGTPFATEKGRSGSALARHRATPDMSEDLGELVKREEYLIVDGSNLATGNGGQVAYIWTLQKVMAQIEGKVKGYKIFVGSRFRHIVDGKEEFKKLETEGKVFQEMYGRDDDDILLHEANRQNAIVLTRDAYAKKEALDESSPRYNDEEMEKVRERMQTYPWLLDKTRFIGHYVDFAEKTITFSRFMPIQPVEEDTGVTAGEEIEKRGIEYKIPEEEEHSTTGQKEPEEIYVECSGCHRNVRRGDYCNLCGAPLKEGMPRIIDDTCPQCGGVVDRWTLSCKDCGAHFDAWICDLCGSPVDVLTKRCHSCGARYEWMQLGAFPRVK